MSVSLAEQFSSSLDQTGYSDLTVIIPTLNEASSVGLLLELVSALYPGAFCTVVDDGSHDGTQEIVRRQSEFLRSQGLGIFLLERKHALTRGITASVIEAVHHVSTRYFVVIDGDLQHPPEKIGEMIEILRKGSDLVVANRMSLRQGQSPARGVTTRVATVFARRFLRRRGVEILDPMSGFFGGKTRVIKNLVSAFSDRFEPGGYKVLFDLLKVIGTTSGYASLQIGHVSYRFQPRPRGQSKLAPRHIGCFIRSLVR